MWVGDYSLCFAFESMKNGYYYTTGHTPMSLFPSMFLYIHDTYAMHAACVCVHDSGPNR